MKTIFALAVACTLATSAFAQDASTQLTLISIKNGETLPIYRTTVVSYHCEPIFLGVDGLDVLEGPPELSLKFELGMVPTASTLRDCPKPVNGVIVTMTAKDVTERKEAVLTFRVNLKSKQGPVQRTARYRVLMFPSTEGSSKQGDAEDPRHSLFAPGAYRQKS
jgi:hypothetical protein